MVFNGVFRVVRDNLGEAAARECDTQRKARRSDFISYPVADFLQVSWTAADMLEPVLGSADAAHVAFGYRAVDNMLDSAFGKMLRIFAGEDPKRLLSQISPAYAALFGYGKRAIRFTSDNSGIATYEREFLLPSCHEGAIDRVLALLGRRNYRAVGRETSFMTLEMEISWQ